MYIWNSLTKNESSETRQLFVKVFFSICTSKNVNFNFYMFDRIDVQVRDDINVGLLFSKRIG